ncbi:MAG: ATPase [Bacteroidetes bacterium]|nr:MAG: ATPase [Bacteroidota bacterium]
MVRFTDAIRYSENKRYLRYVLIPIAFLGLIFMISPSFFTELFTKSSARIIRYNESFAEPAPFNFEVENKKMEAFKNEDFTLNLKLAGKAIPTEVFLVTGGRRYKMTKNDMNHFGYDFPKIQKGVDFYFEAAGFKSKEYDIKLLERPSLANFNAYLSYPAYLGKPNEKWNNIGNLVVPEGTQIKWDFQTNKADKVWLMFNENRDTVSLKPSSTDNFSYQSQVRNSQSYQVRLGNAFSYNKEPIQYYINVIPDLYPKITMQDYRDTAVYNFISIGGSISDDYGLSGLKMMYRVVNKDKAGQFQAMNIPMESDQSIQNYYYQLSLSDLNLKPGDYVEYYVQVWDNDGVNGAKSSRSHTSQFRIPTSADMQKEIDKGVQDTEKQIDKAMKKAQDVQKDIKEIEKKLVNKDRLDYQDKKNIEDVIKKREELVDEVKKLQMQNEALNEKQERFDENSEKIKEKMEQLQQLMNEMLDEETKKLYEELKKLLEQNRDADPVMEKLKEISEQENNLEKELDRAMEMFKQMQFEQKVEKTAEELEKLAEDQEKLSEQTDKMDDKKSEENKNLSKEEKQAKQDELKKEQEDLNKRFEDIKKDLEELEKMDKDLEKPNGMEKQNDEMEQDKQDVDKEQENSKDNLEKKDNKNASKSQKSAGKKMKKMAESMMKMAGDQEKEQEEEDANALRAILENLVQLSHDQENLMKEFRNVQLSDPRFIGLAQRQTKLQDDSKIIEDSLNALAKRVFQIQSFITRELGDMKRHMTASTEGIKKRHLGNATGKQQQAMTSMNNLALMLSDVLNQMQDAMQQGGGGGGMKVKNKKKQKGKGDGKGKDKDGNTPNMSELQKKLNQQIQDLKKSGKTGKGMSEELAKLAAEQRRLRNALQQLEKMAGSQLDKNAKDQLGKQIQELKKEMEKIEEDLVNKRLDRIDQKRQKEIETRLLESEKALREREEEPTRKAETGKDKQKTPPPAMNQYLKNKEKQIELLKTIPPSLSPYYKKEVDEYFEKIDK